MGWINMTEDEARAFIDALPPGGETTLHLFAGAGGGILADSLTGHLCVGAVEIEEFPQKVLMARMKDESLPRFPLWDDVRTFDAKPWKGKLRVISGGFPCFVAGTHVLTDTGFRPIETLAVGDLVLTHKGRWRKVTSVMRRKAKKTVILKGLGFPAIRTTPEHPFFTRARRKKWHNPVRRYRWEITEPAWTEAGKIGLKTLVGQVLPPERDDSRGVEFWWLVGWWLAEGWRIVCNGKGRVVLCCGFPEADMLDARIKAAGFTACRSVERSGVKFHITRQGFHKFLEPFGTGASGKRIPRIALELPKEKAAALLDGYWSGDGHACGKGKLRATSVSRALVLGLALLEQRVRGVVAHIHESKVPNKTVIEGRIVNQRKPYEIVSTIQNKMAFVEGSYGWKPVRKIESAGAAEVWNISVEEDESYVADGVIVHNCQDLSVAGRGAGIKEGTRSGLWFEFARIIKEAAPDVAWIENVPAIRGKGLDIVIGDLVDLGYDARWGVVSAADAGAPHLRKRFWCRAVKADGSKAPACVARRNSETRQWEALAPHSVDKWIPYSGTFPVWGATRGGELFLPPEPRLPTADPGAVGFWPSPEGEDGPEEQWPTPAVPNGGRAMEEGMGPTGRMPDGTKRQVHLAHKVLMAEKGGWPTPRTGKMTGEDEESWRRRNEEGKVATPPLALAVKMAEKEQLPTPTKYDSTPGGPNNHYQGLGWKAKTGRWKDQAETVEQPAEGRESFPTPTKSMATVQDMEQARFAGDDPRCPKYADALPDFGTWDTPENDGSLIDPATGKKTWPTPTKKLLYDYDQDRAHQHGHALPKGEKTWPTPRASSGGPDFARADRPESGGDDLLTAVVRDEREQFGTPTASMQPRSEKFRTKTPNPREIADAEVAAQKEQFGTPTASMKFRSGEFAEGRALNPKEAALAEAAGNEDGKWPTPTAGMVDVYNSLTTNNDTCKGFREKGVNTGQLNPAWVEWLMGWPIGWTSLEPLNQEWFEMWKNGTGPWTDGFWWEDDPSRSPLKDANWPTPCAADWRRRGPNSRQQGLPETVHREQGVQEGFAPRVAGKVPDRIARLAALGNGQVPATVALAWTVLEGMRETAPSLDEIFNW